MIQRRIAAPLLIDGWAFDLGVYVVVTKVPSGLRYAVFDDILLRFCADRFTPTHAALQRFAAEGGAVLPTLQRGWVVSDEYMPARRIPSLQRTLVAPGNRNIDALSSYLEAHTAVRWPNVWSGLQQVLSRCLSVVQHEERNLTARYELVRFDFQLDQEGTPWLIEVNSGPNMHPRDEWQRSQLERLSSFLFDVLSPLAEEGALEHGSLEHGSLEPDVIDDAETSRKLRLLSSAGGRSRALEHEGKNGPPPPPAVLPGSSCGLARPFGDGTSNSFSFDIPSTSNGVGPASYDKSKCSGTYFAGHGNVYWLKLEDVRAGATLDLSSCGFDTDLSLFKGPCDSLEMVACNGDGGSCDVPYGSLIDAYQIEAGTQYYIAVGGYNGGGAATITATYPAGSSAVPFGVGCAPALGVQSSVEYLTPTIADHPGLKAGPLALRALAFSPVAANELWLADDTSDGMVVLDMSDATGRLMKDRAQYHYMSNISSFSFDAIGQFATCQESLNDYYGHMQPNFFQGPTLYDASTDRVALVNGKQMPCEEGETCFLIHVDMLHESPLCMGIAHDGGAASVVHGKTWRNVYWTFDGVHNGLVRFDFESDHGPGSMEHQFASVRRYEGLALERVAGVPSQMVADAASRTLFVADTGNGRVLAVAMDSGYFSRDARHDYFIYSSPMASFNYSVWKGLHWSVLAAVPSPSGLALSADGSTLYVGSRSGGSVYAFLAASGLLLQTTSPVGSMGLGPTGLALSEAGELLFVAGGDQLGRVHVTEPCLVDSLHDSSCTNGLVDGEETDVDCGGRVCRRCGLGASCAIDADCSSGSCEGGACAASVSAPAPTGLQGYLSSETYAQSFMHHMAHGDMGGASYLNPYPLMEPHFCDTVGTLNQSGIGPINCSRIDFDALLLGGCWCHQCLPENPCGNGGLCVNYNKQGYECDCAGTGYGGDHCTTRRPPSPPPPPPSPLSPPPSPPSPPLPPPPPAFPSKGVLILDGNSNTQACVHDATATRHLNVAIAAQCCDGSTCKRKSSSSNDDCIAGMWSSSFEYTTWQEASSRCAALGYTLCDKNCVNAGCNYNSIWVWTSEPCPLPYELP